MTALAGMVAVLCVLGATAPSATADDPTPTASPSASPTATPTATAVDDAVLRWGVSNEANNAAFAPRTYNFFSAGKIANPGRGGQTITASKWHATAGDVEIEKWTGSRWKRATWAGLSTDVNGTTLTPGGGRFSGHQVVFGDGVGTVDTEAGTASLAWHGSFTILFYSGMSFFYVTDPRLEVSGGSGTLTGTLSGYASSQSDTSVWEPVAPRTVTLAELPSVDLADDGFTADAAYAGVEVTGVPQVLSGDHAGSFPQSWIDFTDRLGTAAFWYSSGGATDAYKAALPVTVGLGDDAGGPSAPAPDSPTASAAPTAPVVDNDAPDPPASTGPVAPVSPPTSAALGPPGVAPPVANPVSAAAPGPVMRLVAARASPRAGPRDPGRPLWLAGAALLALAAIATVGSLAGRSTSARR